MRTCFILAAGSQKRWEESGGVGLKQLIEIAGEPIIRRVYRLARPHCDELFTVVNDPASPAWSGLNAVAPEREPWMGEMGKFLDHRPYWPAAGEVVVLYGDAYYTEATIDTIFGHEPTQPTVYGRANAPDRLCEAFGIRFRTTEAELVESVARSAAAHGLNGRGGAFRWFLHRHTGATSYDVDRVRELAVEDNGWVELGHDATDDFDSSTDLTDWRRRFGQPTLTRRRVNVPRKIATTRVYGRNRHGRRVLVAAPGQPLPEGFDEAAAPPPSTDAVDNTPPVSSKINNKMTVPQLRDEAAKQGIDPTGLNKKQLLEALDA